MTKKMQVKTILEVASLTPKNKIPVNSDNSINMEKFVKTPEFQAIITLFKMLDVDADWLQKNGFIPAIILYGSYLQ